MRAALAAAGTRLLEAVLAGGDDGYAGPHARCGAGHQAGYAGRREKTVSTVFGRVQVMRAWASGAWVDRIVGLEGTVEKLVLVSAPDGTGHIELTKFTSPTFEGLPSQLPSNAYGLRHVAYRVADVNATVAAARELGYDLVGEVADFQDLFRLAYVRGPEGLILELTEDLNATPADG
jgi:catechol 2,3-dioxygenase-like lactoylglutathione lyase family enzyme